MIILLLILAVAGLLAYMNRATLLVWYHNWRAKSASDRANAAAASADEPARIVSLREQRESEAKAAAAAKSASPARPTVSGEVKK